MASNGCTAEQGPAGGDEDPGDSDEDSDGSEGGLEDQDPLLPPLRPLADPLDAGLLDVGDDMDADLLDLDGDIDAGLLDLNDIQQYTQDIIPDWDVASSISTQLAMPSVQRFPSVSVSGRSPTNLILNPITPASVQLKRKA